MAIFEKEGMNYSFEDANEWFYITEMIDDVARERVHRQIAPCTNEEFMKAYIKEDPDFEDILRTEFGISYNEKGDAAMKYTARDIHEYLKRYYTPWDFETWAGRSIIYAVFIDKQGLLTPQYAGGMYKYEMCCDIPEGETMLEFRAKHERLDYRPFYEICAALADQVNKPIVYHQARFLVQNYYDECIDFMDADIMYALDAAGYDNEYDFFAAYLIAHREKYGVDFIMVRRF